MNAALAAALVVIKPNDAWRKRHSIAQDAVDRLLALFERTPVDLSSPTSSRLTPARVEVSDTVFNGPGTRLLRVEVGVDLDCLSDREHCLERAHAARLACLEFIEERYG